MNTVGRSVSRERRKLAPIYVGKGFASKIVSRIYRGGLVGALLRKFSISEPEVDFVLERRA